MSERNTSAFIPMTVILAVFIYIEFTLFLSHGLAVSTAIDAATEIDLGDLSFFLIAFITLILSVFICISISITFLKDKFMQSFKKINTLLTCIILVLFLFQILLGFLSFTNIL